jgi:hypothetical protein
MKFWFVILVQKYFNIFEGLLPISLFRLRPLFRRRNWNMQVCRDCFIIIINLYSCQYYLIELLTSLNNGICRGLQNVVFEIQVYREGSENGNAWSGLDRETSKISCLCSEGVQFEPCLKQQLSCQELIPILLVSTDKCQDSTSNYVTTTSSSVHYSLIII